MSTNKPTLPTLPVAPPVTADLRDLEGYEDKFVPVGEAYVGSPSDWEITSVADTIIATNRHTNAVYEGSMAGFNKLLRG
jgi:hypothetical protein